MMLDNFGVGESNWRDALLPERDCPTAPADFARSESPRFIGRAIAAIAADPNRQRWNQRSVSSGELGTEYGFTDADGSRPDFWHYQR